MTAPEIVAELAKLGSESTKSVLLKHGAKEPFYGVKIEDLKKIQKRVKKDHKLALELYDTGISDAMYLAAFVAEPEKMTRADLKKWAKKAYWNMLSSYSVPWVAAESRFGAELAREWIESDQELIAICGWSTFASIVGITPDADLDFVELEQLLGRVAAEIHTAPNRVRYTMNGFVIAVGGSVAPLTAKAKATAKAIGKVTVDMGDTSCKVPNALEYIAKIESRGKLGAKRKTAMC